MREELISKAVMNYAERFTSLPLLECLQQIEHETYEKLLNSRMLAGNYQGTLLTLLSFLIRPNRVLEVGTYVGYSAICLAQGLKEKGKLITIEKKEEYIYKAKANIKRSPFDSQIDVVCGDAVLIIPDIITDEGLDLVFIDGDKREYSSYLSAVLPKMKKGGLIISDNVLLDGKVLDESIMDEDTISIRDFNHLIFNHESLYSVFLPIRDGLFLSFVK